MKAYTYDEIKRNYLICSNILDLLEIGDTVMLKTMPKSKYRDPMSNNFYATVKIIPIDTKLFVYGRYDSSNVFVKIKAKNIERIYKKNGTIINFWFN